MPINSSQVYLSGQTTIAHRTRFMCLLRRFHGCVMVIWRRLSCVAQRLVVQSQLTLRNQQLDRA
eukprot:14558696-Heterocapsa_arctica.AAC.1